MGFGDIILERREELAAQEDGAAYSLRQVARRAGLQPSYLSQVERGIEAPPSEAKIQKLAEVLGLSSDFLLAIANKVPSDIRQIIGRHPDLYCALIRRLAAATPQVLEELIERLRRETSI